MRTRCRAPDRGSTTLELAIVFPAVLLAVTALIQYGLWFHGRSLAQAAAAQGVTAARSDAGNLQAGADRAAQFLTDHAADTVLDPVITTDSPASGIVQVRVDGRVPSVLPFAPGLAVSQAATGPVERFATAGSPP